MTELFFCLDPVIVSFLFVLLVYTWKPKILFEIFELLFLIIIIRLDNHQCVPLFPFACPSTVCLSEIRFCIIDFKHGLKLALSNYGKIFSFKLFQIFKFNCFIATIYTGSERTNCGLHSLFCKKSWSIDPIFMKHLRTFKH